MDKKTGISVKRTKLLNRNVKADFKRIFTSLSKAAIMFSSGSMASGLKETVGVFENLRISENSENLAYQLILTALVNSAHNLSEENRNRFTVRLENAEQLFDDKEYCNFLDGITTLVETKEIILEIGMLKKPRLIPFLEDFQEYFKRYLHVFGLSQKDAELISRRLPTYFVFALNNEWRANYGKYQHLLQSLDGPISDSALKEQEWEAYNSFLEREVEKPVFGESFSLKDIFISPRAYYQKKIKRKDGKKEKQKSVIFLDLYLKEWLENKSIGDTIKVIQGGPGSGKSSFVRWWSGKIVKETNIPVLFFPLHHFNIHTNLKSAIGEFFNDLDHIPIDHNPVEDTKGTEKMLLIFDGLDELVIRGKSSREAANAFIQELKDFCNSKNGDKQRIKVIVTGRPIAIQNTESKLRESDEQILFLLPFFLTEDEKEGYLDPKNLLENDQRNDWWNLYFSFKDLPNRNLPLELRNENMDKITSEPLLNYLVALSWQKDPEYFNENTNINDVYHQLMLAVFERDYDPSKKHRGTGDLAFDQFLQILEEIAICAWQGGDSRVTTERMIEEHINKRGLKKVLDDYKASAKSGVSRLLTAFYFRKFGKDETDFQDDTFEFTHKSFGEYLAARAIVELIKATHEQRELNKKGVQGRYLKGGWTIEETLFEWLQLTGQEAIDDDLDNFIYNEILVREKHGEPIEGWQETLCEIIGELVLTGIPLHLQPKRLSQLQEMRIARNAEEAILTALSNCAYATGKISNINWGYGMDIPYPSKWINRLSSTLSNFDLAFWRLNHLNLKGVDLSGAHLRQADLTEADLSETHLTATNLNKAHLIKANLANAELTDAILSYANLYQANLTDANLIGANLSGADLREANLSRADFTEANLTRADLRGANLSDANLGGADLRGAFLIGTKIEDTDLRGADLSGTFLDGTYIEGVDVSDLDLGGIDIDI